VVLVPFRAPARQPSLEIFIGGTKYSVNAAFSYGYTIAAITSAARCDRAAERTGRAAARAGGDVAPAIRHLDPHVLDCNAAAGAGIGHE
jgi:hypothetical protein